MGRGDGCTSHQLPALATRSYAPAKPTQYVQHLPMMVSESLRPRPHSFRLTNRRARSLTSSLFGLTLFFTGVLTVSASNVLPCPAHPHRGHTLTMATMSAIMSLRMGGVEKPPRIWIEEHHPRLGYDTYAQQSRVQNVHAIFQSKCR